MDLFIVYDYVLCIVSLMCYVLYIYDLTNYYTVYIYLNEDNNEIAMMNLSTQLLHILVFSVYDWSRYSVNTESEQMY